MGLLGKLVGASVAIALVIKYVGPDLAIPATATNAWVGVLLPTVVMMVLLAWWGRREV
jgi:chromate transport protein ChrA